MRSELNYIKSDNIKPAIKHIMESVNSYSGFTTDKDYHFLFYYIDGERVGGAFKTFGMGSALEHNNSSVYYFGDGPHFDSLYRNYDHIVTHEYYHTITPLTLHSQKIAEFNFAKPDMSKHMWLYEGATDYLSAMVNANSDLTKSITANMNESASYAESRKDRSMTESSENIIKSNMFDFVGKILQLGNFYAKGKLVCFAIDMELIKRSQGKLRFLDVLLKLRQDHSDKIIDDNKMLDLLTEYTYPEMRAYFERYIEGDEMVPFVDYFDKLGWIYSPKGEKVVSYAKGLKIFYNFDQELYKINSVKRNTLGLKKGDFILTVNNQPASRENAIKTKVLRPITHPSTDSEFVSLEVLRDGETIKLTGRPSMISKLKYSRITVVDSFSEEQIMYRDWFFNY